MTIDQSNKSILVSLGDRMKYPMCVMNGKAFFLGDKYIFITDNVSGEILCAVPLEQMLVLLLDHMANSERLRNPNVRPLYYPTQEDKDREIGEAIADALDNQRPIRPEGQIVVINAGSGDIPQHVLDLIAKSFGRG